jgi:large subunit ribosomal protein L12
MEYIYGALLLHKLGKPITEESLKKVIQATDTEVDESKIKSVIVSLEGLDLDKEIESAMTMPVAAASGEESKAEGKKEGDNAEEKAEKKAEESTEGLASLFG